MIINKILLVVSFLGCAMGYGQVGFGTNDPHPSSVADFEGDDKGILIPRVVLTDLDNAKIKPADSRSPAAVKGLLAYNKGNTDTSGGKDKTTKGFYHWDGSKWTKIGNPPTSSSSFLRKTADFTLDKSHHSATIKVDGKRKVFIPDNLPNGFKVTIIGNASERVSIISSVPTIGANRASQIIKNGVARMVFYKDKDDNPLVRLWGDLDSHEAFVTKWEITDLSSSKAKIKIRKPSSDAYNYDIDWGDGTTPLTNQTGALEHTYTAKGTYFLTISGTFPHFAISTNNEGHDDTEKLKGVVNWGTIKWKSMEKAFLRATSMKVTAQDKPDFSLVTNTVSMFQRCEAITTIPGVESWNVSSVTNMTDMFQGAKKFNQDISKWNPNITSDYTKCVRYLQSTQVKDSYMISKFTGGAKSVCNAR